MVLPSGAVNGNYTVVDFTVENASLVVHLLNSNPGGGMPSDWYVSFNLDELPTNMSQTNLKNAILERLRLSHGGIHASLQTLITGGTIINVT
jgi:hypothetical protein